MLPILLIPSLLLHFSFFKSTLFLIPDSNVCTILTLCLAAGDKNEANLQVVAICGQSLAPLSAFYVAIQVMDPFFWDDFIFDSCLFNV